MFFNPTLIDKERYVSALNLITHSRGEDIDENQAPSRTYGRANQRPLGACRGAPEADLTISLLAQ